MTPKHEIKPRKPQPPAPQAVTYPVVAEQQETAAAEKKGARPGAGRHSTEEDAS